MTPSRSFSQSSRGPVSWAREAKHASSGERERELVHGLLWSLRRKTRVDSPSSMATAMGFDVFESTWTARVGAIITLQRGMTTQGRELAIARELGVVLGEWTNACVLSAQLAIEASLMHEAAAFVLPRSAAS